VIGPTFGEGNRGSQIIEAGRGNLEECKMEACLEVLLELNFCIKPPKFRVEAHMERPLLELL
jgi:hypothetical protein